MCCICHLSVLQIGGSQTNKEHYCKHYMRSVDENFLSDWVPKDIMYNPEYQLYSTINSNLSRPIFAYREIPHALTGVSPYQLVYERVPHLDR
ncbi:hypothetical protein TNIN_255651 [Trichonephila inaurata madagascariensis]|uniref:Uncharacterized protein n=1 Tax=Trichonephila inaurata madagascariensis TaxID=2747483 RepID=A0A8X7C727_9ARAC|nr:hypothetical protein TNIN_255651 [Trichonephila inaurata madagascariensis]